jgi:quercetin dioxygenase-like cupin family protein
MEVRVVKQGEARSFYEGPELCREYFKTEKITLGTSTLPPGATGAVDWGHKASHECFICVQGQVSLRTPGSGGGRQYNLTVGDAVIMPEGVPHELTNTGDTEAVVGWCLAPSDG